jgi:DNA polymerase I-like protein with 3'-5' exonuclease and polymerase domains
VWTPGDTADLPVLVTPHLASLFKPPKDEEGQKPRASVELLMKADWQKVGRILRGRWPVRPVPEEWITDFLWWPESPFGFDTEYHTKTGDLLGFSLWHPQMVYAQVGNRVQGGLVLRGTEKGWVYVPQPTQADLSAILHNSWADLPHLARLVPVGTRVAVNDLMLLHSVLWPDLPHDLNTLGSLFAPFNRWKHLLRPDKEEFDLSNPTHRMYAGLDAVATYLCFDTLVREANETDLQLYHEEMLPLIPIILDAQTRGMKVDQDRVAQVKSELEGLIREATLKAQAVVGWPINLRSSTQVSHQLYGRENL